MKFTKTAQYHDATNDTRYLIFFMVPNFPALHLSSLITFPTTSMSHVLTPHAAIPMPVGTGLMKNTGFENDPNEQDF